MTYAELDPADMTLEQLAATWTADPEQDARLACYSTRGANEGKSPKYRATAPEVYGYTFAQLCKPTREDALLLAERPIVVRLRDGWERTGWSGQASKEAKRVLSHFAALNMVLHESAPAAVAA